MESLNSIKETNGVFFLVFAPISVNLYLRVIVFHCPQNNIELFQSLLDLMCADVSEYSYEDLSFIQAVHCLG